MNNIKLGIFKYEDMEAGTGHYSVTSAYMGSCITADIFLTITDGWLCKVCYIYGG